MSGRGTPQARFFKKAGSTKIAVVKGMWELGREKAADKGANNRGVKSC